MNVLLIYPEFPDTFWSLKHAIKFISKPSAYPPLGLLTVAAMLPPEWNLRLVDANVRPLRDRDLAWADCAFISAMAAQRESAERIIARCRARGLRVVAGGPLFTAQRERYADVDHLVLNEAELTLPGFLRDFAAGRAEHVYASPDFADLGQTPIPRWDLVRMASYASMPVQFSRGCPFDCEFCDVTAQLGHLPRTKSAGQVVAELNRLYELGWRDGVFFVDDNLIGNKKCFKRELLPALLEWRQTHRGMPFNTQASINLADDEPLVHQMVQAGFESLFIGIETPNEAALAECRKNQNLRRDLIADVRFLQRAGLQVQAGFILGFDSDSAATPRRLLEFIQQSAITTAMVGLLQAPPGTRLYQRMKAAGRILEEGSGDNVDGTTNIVPLEGAGDLHDAYRELIRKLYTPRAYYQRVRAVLREYRPSVIKARLSPIYQLGQGLAFARSIVRLGVIGKERVEYWKLLAWALVRRPRAFSRAVTLAIYGHHFRVVTERHVA